MEGFQSALDYVSNLDQQGLLEQIDCLYGRDRLPEGYTVDQLKHEAIRQTRLDWLNSQCPDYHMYREMLER